MDRPSWQKYFSDLTKMVATRSTCPKRHTGAIIVKDKQILTTGYNGPPVGVKHCTTCYREENNIPSGTMFETCKAVHAEQNAIIQAAKHGISIKDATIYVTRIPCLLCARMIINSGINILFYMEPCQNNNNDEESLNLLSEGNVIHCFLEEK